MKVLIISHNAISPVSSIGKTLASLFHTFKKEELCQLYIHKALPQGDVCSSYYSFTDKDVLKGIFTRKVAGKTVRPAESINSGNNGTFNSITYGSANKREPYMELLREAVWKLSPWYNKSLKNWVREQNPTCIFAAIGSGTFLYDIALKISKDFNIPIITYVCDDFYNMEKPDKFLGGLWKRNINKKTKELLRASKAVVGICDNISKSYSDEFKIDGFTIMTGTNFSVKSSVSVNDSVERIRYFGKISLNRYVSLLEICKCLDEINEKSGTHYKVDIFCDDPGEEVKNAFGGVKSADFHGFVTGEEFKKEFFCSDALIFVEAFDEESIDRVKNSISTKIADSLSSGIPIFAYGPANISAIKHLVDNECAAVCSEKSRLNDALGRFLSDKSFRNDISQKAIKTAKKFHDPVSVSDTLYNICSSY